MSVASEGIDHIETICSSIADDLAAHVRLVKTLLQYCERFGRNPLLANSSDAGRDLLHLEARVLGTARQLEDMITTLNRLRGRFDVDASHSPEPNSMRVVDRETYGLFGPVATGASARTDSNAE